MTVVVAAQHANVRPWPAGPGPLCPSAMVLYVEAARRLFVPRDLVHALAELGIRIGREPSANPLIGRRERVAAIFAEIVTARRNPEVHAIPVANDRVHAQAAAARFPLARALVIADARHHLPRIAAIMAPEHR